MTDAQMTTIVTVFLAAVIAVLFNNSRITDLRNTMDSRFNDVNRRFDDINRHIDDKFTLLSHQMKAMEENLLRIIGDHETRIQRLERPNEG